jgi:polyphosphate kinase
VEDQGSDGGIGAPDWRGEGPGRAATATAWPPATGASAPTQTGGLPASGSAEPGSPGQGGDGAGLANAAGQGDGAGLGNAAGQGDGSGLGDRAGQGDGAGGESPADAHLAVERFGPQRFLSRELSWLDFGDRILDLASDQSQPLLERVKFLAICSTGLDEFFSVRVAGLKEQIAAGLRTRSPDGRSSTQQLAEIRSRALELTRRMSSIYLDRLCPELAAEGVRITNYDDLDQAARDQLARTFEREIFPVLTPLAVDPGHPFPYISSLSLNLAVIVEDRLSAERRFARVKVPPLLPRFFPVGDGRFVALEQLIGAHLAPLFPEMDIGARHVFRVTRNADLALDDDGEAEDLLEAIEFELRRRRFGRAVRLEVDGGMDKDVLQLLLRELELGDDDSYPVAAPLDLGQLWGIVDLDRPELKAPVWTPTVPALLVGHEGGHVDFFSLLRERDVLVHHPYESFASSVEAFIVQAAADPDVLAIKQTLYRTSGDAPFVGALVRAADAGKQVAALVELKARFDEQRNIAWARQLEQAGVHVVYGVMGLKTHSKTALVVRREPDGIRRYCHIGTGNYNSDTARIYEDLGLLTSSPALGDDLTDLFNHITGLSRPGTSRQLILAPERFRPWLLESIAGEAELGPEGWITIKVNGLTDPEVVDALYAASRAGVRIELLVRGLCTLRPGVEGLSETITVRSIVGRFLEHSRIYRFGPPVVEAAEVLADGAPPVPHEPAGRPSVYVIGSADMMERNLDHRIEALVPVEDPELCAQLEEVLQLCLADDVGSFTLAPDGSWHRVPERIGLSVQRRLQELALERSRRRRPTDPL